MLSGIGSSEITPERLYVSRREFLIATGALAATTLFLGGCRQPGPTSGAGGADFCQSAQASKPTDELGDSLTVCDSIISYNNFYEFSTEKYGRFEALYDPKQLPGQRRGLFKWPYVEGLRLDEAMHDFTILATGIYGKPLPPQNGAPVRLVAPWKYGFKSIKSIVKIDLVEEMPVSLWMLANPMEYGFYSNVNPQVDHPRWSQATERRIPGYFKNHSTLMFNGYLEHGAA